MSHLLEGSGHSRLSRAILGLSKSLVGSSRFIAEGFVRLVVFWTIGLVDYQDLVAHFGFGATFALAIDYFSSMGGEFVARHILGAIPPHVFFGGFCYRGHYGCAGSYKRSVVPGLQDIGHDVPNGVRGCENSEDDC